MVKRKFLLAIVKRKVLLGALVGLWCLAALTGCQQTSINPQDSSPPSVVIRVRSVTDGDWHVQSNVTYNGSPIDMIADVEDPQGVKEVKLQYVTTLVHWCTSDGGSVYQGTFPLVNVPPPSSAGGPISTSNGKAPTEWHVPSQLQGPFSVLLERATGIPWNPIRPNNHIAGVWHQLVVEFSGANSVR
jgi:hypothetical protein